MSLSARDEQLFAQLVPAAQTLVTVCNNAATVLSEEFEDMVSGPAQTVQQILSQINAQTYVWDHVFRLEECDIEHFTPDVPEDQKAGRRDTGVKLIHRPTGLSAKAYSSTDVAENELRARRALKDMVERQFPAPRQDPLQ